MTDVSRAPRAQAHPVRRRPVARARRAGAAGRVHVGLRAGARPVAAAEGVRTTLHNGHEGSHHFLVDDFVTAVNKRLLPSGERLGGRPLHAPRDRRARLGAAGRGAAGDPGLRGCPARRNFPCGPASYGPAVPGTAGPVRCRACGRTRRRRRRSSAATSTSWRRCCVMLTQPCEPGGYHMLTPTEWNAWPPSKNWL